MMSFAPFKRSIAAFLAFSLAFPASLLAAPATLHWSQVLKRLSPRTTDKELSVFLDEIPLEGWLDPELHRTIRDHVLHDKRRHFGSGLERLSSKLRWSFVQNELLMKVWLPLEQPEVVQKTLTNFSDLFDWKNPYVRSVLRQVFPVSTRGQRLLRWLSAPSAPEDLFVDLLDRRSDWSEVEEILATDAKLRSQLGEMVLRDVRTGAPSLWSKRLLVRCPSLDDDLLDRYADELLAPWSEYALKEILARRPDLLKRAYSLRKADLSSLASIKFWVSDPDIAADAKGRLMREGLQKWGAGWESSDFPAYEKWIREFPESWVEAQLRSADPKAWTEMSTQFIAIYGISHPGLRKLIAERCPEAAVDRSSAAIALKDTLFELPEKVPFKGRAIDVHGDGSPTVEAKLPDFEERGRLGLGDGRIRYRGLRYEYLREEARHADNWQGLHHGDAVRREFVQAGKARLLKAGIDFNPFNALHRSLERFMRNQVQLLPKQRPLKPHEIEMSVRQAMESWPQNPADPEDLAMRTAYESSLRRKLAMGETEGNEKKAVQALRPPADPVAFAAWRKKALRELEAGLRKLLLVVQETLSGRRSQEMGHFARFRWVQRDRAMVRNGRWAEARLTGSLIG